MKSIPVFLRNEITEDILGLVASPSIVISELAKNSIDSNSTQISIEIDTHNSTLTITDNGDGFSENDIILLGQPGISLKKQTENIHNKNGYALAGNKGLGILSSFSLGNLVEMTTTTKDKSFFVTWEKSSSIIQYVEIDLLPTTGTTISIKNINHDNIKILTDSSELSKLRHITSNLYEGKYKDISLSLKIDNKTHNLLSDFNISNFDDNFVYKISFNYDSTINSVNFVFKKAIIPEKRNKNSCGVDILLSKITIPLSSNIDLKQILYNEYGVTKTVSLNDYNNFKYLENKLEDFYGEFNVTERTASKELKSIIGHGVKVFVNGYAMYSYLDNENDWLGLSQLSQRKKNTTLKSHNVYGFINFNNLNEKISSLKIANERANFVENTAFKKFIEIIKHIITQISFNIDIAYRNGNILKDYSRPNTCIDNKNSYAGINEGNSTDTDECASTDTDEANSTDTNETNSTDTNETNSTDTDEPNSTDTDEPNSTDTDEPNSTDTNETNSTDTNETNSTDTDEGASITPLRKKKNNFFVKSNVLKSDNSIPVEYNELINQLRHLNYESYYLLYNLSFRSILEDISKRYLIFRRIPLNGDFALNIKIMCDDILNVVKKPTLSQDSIDFITDHFGGRQAFKNFFQTTSAHFHKNGAQGVIGSHLNSLIHNPRRMPLNDAELLANDIIPPLCFASSEIIRILK